MAQRAKRKFEYKRRSEKDVKKRANRSGGDFDPVYLDNYEVFRPSEGDVFIRVLPPTWEGADDWATDVWLHSGVGPKKGTYACLAKNLNKPCPICEERDRAQRAGDEEYAKQLKPYSRSLCLIVDRKQPDAGVLLYPMPWTLNRDLNGVCVDKHTNEVLWADDPEDGYDFVFTIDDKSKQWRQYVGAQVSRRPQPLSDRESEMEEWLAKATEHPVPDQVIYRSYEELSEIFSGMNSATEEDTDLDDEDDEPATDGGRILGNLDKRAAQEEDDLEDEDLGDLEDDESLDDDPEDLPPPPRRSRAPSARDGDRGTRRGASSERPSRPTRPRRSRRE